MLLLDARLRESGRDMYITFTHNRLVYLDRDTAILRGFLKGLPSGVNVLAGSTGFLNGEIEECSEFAIVVTSPTYFFCHDVTNVLLVRTYVRMCAEIGAKYKEDGEDG